MSSAILTAAPTPKKPQRGQLLTWKFGVATSVVGGMGFGTVTVRLGDRVLASRDFQRLSTNVMKSTLLTHAPRTGKYSITIKGVIAVDGPYGPEEREKFAGRRTYYVETTG